MTDSEKLKPLVGITAWRRRLDTYYGPERMQTLATYYAEAVAEAGMTPLIIPNGQTPEEAPALVSLLDGLILSGGDDVDPDIYNSSPESSRGIDADVDRFEIALVEAAREQGKPVLAICRGLQLLNVALGGTLQQEVTAAGTPHELIEKGMDPEEVNARRHTVRFEDGSLMAQIYGGIEAKVNTLHHQGIGEIAPDLIVEGRTDDGQVEAARCRGDWWAVGVQWHPERLDGEHRRIFDVFREAIEA
ncbi:MAG: gamma-glutamyl-gamma-aminobutyrate hydrolase family protein [Acidimicrobiia bacterium]